MTDIAALYRDVYASPHEDAPRLRLADALVATGDPRGEFIRCQLAPASDEPAKKRAAALLRKHRTLWLGELARFMAKGMPIEFSRGFASSAWVAIKSEADRAAAEAMVEWATFDSVRFLYNGRSFISDALAPVRSIAGIDDEALTTLSRSRAAFAVEHLGVGPREDLVFEREPYRALLECRDLPRLRSLELQAPSDRAWVFAAPFIAQLERFETYSTNPRELRLCYELALERAPKLRELLFTFSRILLSNLRFALRSSASGRLDECVLHWDPSQHHQALCALEALPRESLTSIEIKRGAAAKSPPSEEQTRQIERVASRFTRLERLALAELGGESRTIARDPSAKTQDERALDAPHGGTTQLRFSADGRLLLARVGHRVTVFDASTGALAATVGARPWSDLTTTFGCQDFDLSDDNHTLVLVEHNRLAALDLRTRGEIRRGDQPPFVWHAAIHHGSNRIVAWGNGDKRLHLFSLEDLSLAGAIKLKDNVERLFFVGADEFILAHAYPVKFQRGSLTTQKLSKHVVTVEPSLFASYAASPDGRHLAVTSPEHGARLYTFDGGDPVVLNQPCGYARVAFDDERVWVATPTSLRGTGLRSGVDPREFSLSLTGALVDAVIDCEHRRIALATSTQIDVYSLDDGARLWTT